MSDQGLLGDKACKTNELRSCIYIYFLAPSTRVIVKLTVLIAIKETSHNSLVTFPPLTQRTGRRVVPECKLDRGAPSDKQEEK